MYYNYINASTKVLMQINVNPIFIFRLCLLPFSFYAIISLIIENKSMDIVRLRRWAWIMLVWKSLFFHSIERAASYLHRRSLNSAGSKSGADKFFGPKIPIWSEILQYQGKFQISLIFQFRKRENVMVLKSSWNFNLIFQKLYIHPPPALIPWIVNPINR